MNTLVLDTHTALWWSFLPEKLSRTARKALDDAEELLFPGIVFWEAALLVRKKRIELPVTLEVWLQGLASNARFKIIALDGSIALHADGLRMHEDPADRFIVATALLCKAPLVTKDRAIRSAKLVEVVW